MGKATCSVEGCDRPAIAKGLCGRCYQRIRRHGEAGDPTVVLPPGTPANDSPMPPCAFPGCAKPARARTGERSRWCPMHYRRVRLWGDPASVLKIIGSAESQYRAKVGPPDLNGCRPWLGKVDNRSGYGVFSYTDPDTRRKVTISAHAFGWGLSGGEIPRGRTRSLDHRCHDPAMCAGGPDCPHRRCQEPTHLRVVSQRENTLRSNNPMAVNARKTHCVHGHAFTPENTRVYLRDGSPRRACRACARVTTAARRRAGYREDPPDPVKRRARSAVQSALRRGILTRAPCETCGRPNAQAHHDDYARPLDVRWLCVPCHAAVHRYDTVV